MIGFGCPWCDGEASLEPAALAAGCVVCASCGTQVDLAVDPAVVPDGKHGPGVALPLAA
jgi:hypothetical protein